MRCSPDVQGKFHRARQLARRFAREQLPAWACMEAVAAEVLSALGSAAESTAADILGGREFLDADGNANSGGAVTRAAGANVCAPSALPAVRRLAERVDEADAFELDVRLRRAIALEQRLEVAMAPLLGRVADERWYRCAGDGIDDGYPSMAAYVRDRLGMGERKARALVRLARAAGRCSREIRRGSRAAVARRSGKPVPNPGNGTPLPCPPRGGHRRHPVRRRQAPRG